MDGWSAGGCRQKNKDSPPADDVLHHHLGAVLVWCKRKLTTKQMTQSTYHVWGWNSLARRQWFVVLNRRPIEVAVRHQLTIGNKSIYLSAGMSETYDVRFFNRFCDDGACVLFARFMSATTTCSANTWWKPSPCEILDEEATHAWHNNHKHCGQCIAENF